MDASSLVLSLHKYTLHSNNNNNYVMIKGEGYEQQSLMSSINLKHKRGKHIYTHTTAKNNSL